MSRYYRAGILLACATAIAVIVSGCSVGPPRDVDGRVTETTVVGSTTMEVGDCFTFAADPSEASVTPCVLAHSYIVIGKGELDAATVAAADSVQNAASAACSEAFAAFKAAAAEGVRPTQEFIIATEDRDGETVTLYTCVATDEG